MKKIYLLCTLLGLVALNIASMGYAGEKATVTVSASTIYENYVASNAVDGNPATYWVGARYASPWWITFDIGKVITIETVKCNWLYEFFPTDYSIQVSSDGEHWQDVLTGLSGSYNGTDTHEFSEPARYVRIYINSVNYLFPTMSEAEVYVGGVPIPSKLRFQGRLKDAADVVLEGTYSITFRIYDTETGGEPLWSETKDSLEMLNGMLDVVLGESNEMTILFNKQYYLGVEIEDDGEMTPRFLMTPAPYAITCTK